MKRIHYLFTLLLLTAGLSFVLWGCEDISEVEEPVGLKYLSVEESPDNQYSAEELAIIKEAFERIDPYVEFKNGMFHIKKVHASNIALSGELFGLAVKTMQYTNQLLRTRDVVEVKPNVLRVVGKKDPLNGIRLKGLGEDPLPPNSDGYDMRWYGADVYLSRATLTEIKDSGNDWADEIRELNFLPTDIFAAYVDIMANYMGSFTTYCPSGLIIYIWFLGGPVGGDCQ